MPRSRPEPGRCPRLDAVLCDVDGVLRIWDPDGMSRTDRAYGLPPGTLAAAAFAPARLLPAVTGRVTDGQWRALVADDLAAACGSLSRARAVVADWSAQTGDIDVTVRDVLAALRPAVRVVLVSNATTRLEEDLARARLLDHVDDVVNSSRVQAAKPDPRIYRIAARRAGAPPERCLFIDDTPENVDAARRAGMAGLHYTSPDDLRAWLNSHT